MENEYSDILFKMMTMSNQIKLYHWQTLLHPRHVSTDKLYSKMNELIDKFIECLTGRLIIQKENIKFRIQLNKPIVLENIEYEGKKDKTGFKIIRNYINYLESKELNKIISNYTDLTNIRDEMLGELNQISYLFSLK